MKLEVVVFLVAVHYFRASSSAITADVTCHHLEVQTDILTRFRSSEGFNRTTDINVTTRDGKLALRAHKLVLAMRSPVWKSLLYPDAPEVLALDVDSPSILKTLLKYVYEEVLDSNSVSDALELNILGQKYQVDGLKEATDTFLKNNLNAENVRAALLVAESLNSTDEDYLLQMIDNQFMQVFSRNVVVQDFSRKTLLKILRRPFINAPEWKILKVVSTWMGSYRRQRENASWDEFLPYINMKDVSLWEYKNYFRAESFMTKDQLDNYIKSAIREILPTDGASHPRWKMSSRPIDCGLCIRTAEKFRYSWRDAQCITKHLETQQVIRFNADCSPGSCSMTGLRVTWSYSDGNCRDLDLPVRFALYEDSSGRQLTRVNDTLQPSTAYVLSLPKPVPLNNIAIYGAVLEIDNKNISENRRQCSSGPMSASCAGLSMFPPGDCSGKKIASCDGNSRIKITYIYEGNPIFMHLSFIQH